MKDTISYISENITKRRMIQHLSDTMFGKWPNNCIQNAVTVYGADGIPMWWVYGTVGHERIIDKNGNRLVKMGTVTAVEYNAALSSLEGE